MVKKLLRELLLLLLLLAAIFIILEYLFRDYKNAVDLVMDNFSKTKTEAEVLILGNSHTLPFYKNLKGVENSNVACLTIGGDDLFWMQALLKKQLEGMPRIKYIIFNCDDELLGFNQSLSGMHYMNRVLYRYTGAMYKNKLTDILLSKSNFFRSNRDIGYLIHKPANTDMMIVNASGTGGFSDEECKARALEISEKRFQRRLFSENLIYISSILREAGRCQARIFVLKMPKSDCLQAEVNHANLDASRVLLDSIFTANGVETLDFSKDNTFARDEYDNPDHLTPVAAGRLLKMINDSIFSAAGVRPIRLNSGSDSLLNTL